MYRVTFFRPTASSELPKLEAIGIPSLSAALAVFWALRAFGCKTRLWGRNGALWV